MIPNISSILSALIVMAMAFLVKSIWKLVKTIESVEESSLKLSITADTLNKRVDVHDQIFSDIVGRSVDSQRIVDGLEDRPVFIHKKPIRDC